ncbi:MAG: aldehyde dehydrogenase family protein [Bacteroidales bacterium]
MEEYKIYKAGEFVKTDKELEVNNPYDGSAFAKTYLAGKRELDESIELAKNAENTIKNLPSHKRYEILMVISEGIKEQRDKLAKTLAMQAGKPLKYAFGEIDRAIQGFIIAAEESKRLPKEYMSIDWTAKGVGKEGIVKHFPIGIIAGISPFNFPMNLAVHKIAPAIASGNPIILKPARSTPLSVLQLAKIIHQTDLPKGALSVLPMDRNAGNQLVTDERIKMLSFTGSPSVGWKMKQNCGKKKIALELGGNAGVVVSDTADIDQAAEKCVVGGFAYSGQVCIHTQRIYVHQNIFDSFHSKFTEKVTSLKQGDPLKESTDISVLIDQSEADRIEDWVNEAVNNGAKILTGGKKDGSFYHPTVLTNTKQDMKVCSLEIFGPVVTLEPFNDFAKAVEEINNSDYGLQAGLFTNKINEMNYAFNSIEAGGIIINDVPTFRVDHMPYGGMKDSGFGREGIKYSIKEMMEPKLMVKNT